MRIDEIAWHEQVDRELSESKAPAYEFSPTRIETELRGLGSGLDAALLDALENEEGYLVWALRLSPFVHLAHPKERARAHLNSPDWEVRYWARKISGSSS